MLLALAFPAPAQRGNRGGGAQPDGAVTNGAAPSAPKPAMNLEPFPADKSVPQTIHVNGKTIQYTATVGTIHLEDDEGKPTADVMYIAYTVDGPNRPVTFALNGGPGASSVYLNLGAIGPKHIAFANQGDSASDPTNLTDNPGTWLDFTDLVFIDPVGTGFSRSLVDEAETRKLFYASTPDIQYISLVMYKWLVKNERLQSKKYYVGESYGGYRGPRIAHYLQSQIGVAFNGVTLVSPALRPPTGDSTISPVPWMVTLPSITAAHLENEGKLSAAAMAPVIAYTEGDYATALIKGPADKALNEAMIKHVTEMTGLDPKFVRDAGGRLETGAFLREVHREQGTIGSVYDSNVTLPDPFPYSAQQEGSDPILESIIAPTTTAMADFITRVVGWKTEARYHALNYEVRFTRDQGQRGESAADLREAISADPKLKVLIVHGWNDLSCPFMGSIITANQLPYSLQKQVEIQEFPGGHMFYTRQGNGAGLHEAVENLVKTH